MSESSETLSRSGDSIERCEERIGYRFQEKSLLKSALTHASGASHRLESNERLEFLGDAILGRVVCEALFLRYTNFLEGDLTRIKSVVVSRLTCAKLSRELGLEEFLIVGKGMSSSPSVPPSLLADVFEAIIAAIYLDGGPKAAEEFVMRNLEDEIEAAVSGEAGANFKSALQQFAQREHGATPSYLLLDEKGPDHSKCFQVAAQVAGVRYGAAWGRNKKEAEQRAAENALCEIEGRPAEHITE